MKIRTLIVLFISCIFCSQNIAVCSDDENTLSKNNEKESYQELYRLVSKDKSVTAIWVGEDPRILTESPDTPLRFGVKKLIFQFAEDNKTIEFKPRDDLYYNWSFDIFSEDGRNVVLLQDYYGTYHVIKTKDLREYLSGKAPPFEIVNGQDPDADGGVIHEIHYWIADDTFEFTVACCGDERVVRHKIGHKTTRALWRNQESFYFLVAFVVCSFFIIAIGIAIMIKYFKKKKITKPRKGSPGHSGFEQSEGDEH